MKDEKQQELELEEKFLEREKLNNEYIRTKVEEWAERIRNNKKVDTSK